MTSEEVEQLELPPEWLDVYKRQVLPKKPSYGIPGNLQQNYVDAILSDAQYGVSKSVLDYFVFPRLRKEIVNEDTLETEISSFEDFIKELEQKKRCV